MKDSGYEEEKEGGIEKREGKELGKSGGRNNTSQQPKYRSPILHHRFQKQ